MEQRLKSLEDLCELVTKEIVQQNKNMIEVNKSLLSEIKSLREAYVKQDDDFEEFKSLLRKIYDLNRQNSYSNQLPLMFPSNMQQPGQPQQSSMQPPIQNLNSSLMVDQVNQSMLNNLSFQSERTPLNQHNLNPNTSAYSVPSSASALQSQQFMPFFNQNLPQPPTAVQQQPQQQQQQLQPPKNNLFPPNVAALPKPSPSQQVNSLIPPFNPNQPPPTNTVNTAALSQPKQAPFSFSNLLGNSKQPEPQQQQQQQPKLPIISQTTSTPQASQFSFSKLQQQPSVQPTVDLTKPKFQFSPTKPTTAAAKPEAASLFGSNLFKTTTPEKSQPLFGGLPAATPPLMKAPEPTSFGNVLKNINADEDSNDGPGGANPEDFEPQLDFKPIVKLHEVEVKTGEEDEDVLFKQRCKLFRFVTETKEWKEKGLGEIKLLQHKQTKVIRILMRRDQVLKLCANHRLSPGMTIKEMAPKQLSWLATDFSENVASTEMLLAKFKTVEDGNQFKLEFEKAVEASKSLPSASPAAVKTLPPTMVSDKPSLSEALKSDKWNCTGCYAPNKKEDSKCMCCGTLKPGTTAAPAASVASAQKATVPSGLFSFGTKTIESPSKNTTQQPFSFGSTTSPAKPFSFGQQHPNQQQTQSNQPKVSFPTTQLNLDASKTQPQPTNNPQTNLFGQSTATNAPFGIFGQNKDSPSAPKAGLFSFGQAGQPSSQQQAAQPSVLFQKSSLPTFASLANTPNPLFGSTEASPATKSAFTGGLTPSSEPPKPLFKISNTEIRSQPTGDDGDEAGGGDANPEEYEPQVDFKPLVKLQEVEVKTGEEDEIAVFKQRCKLYRFDSDTKEWKEKGTGEMKILKHKINEGMYRILMRRDQVLKLCANHRITSDLKFEIYNEKQVRWHAQDYSEGEGKHETLAARFKNEEEAKNFIKEADEAKKVIETMSPTKQKQAPKPVPVAVSTKPNLSDMFKNDNKWKCDACYAPNSNDVVKCACCSTLKPGATEKAPSAGEQAAASGLSKISFGSTGSQSQPSNILFGSQSNTPAKFEFGSKTVFGGLTPSKTTTSTFAPSTITAPAENPNQPDVATIFGNKADMSFGDLAKKSQPSGFGGGFISSGLTQSPGASLFSNFGKAPAPVFGSQSANKQQDNEDEAGGDDNNNPEEYEPQVDFKPLVKLQEVEVKTGEEDEEVLFKQRCKLYRFNTDTKEWKEKGVGEIKVLKHKIKENCFRVLMRRDQVHKLCANHRIDPSIKLETVNEKQLRWFVNDCSEDEPHPELLLAKFRAEDDVTKFRAEFVKAQQILSANPSTQKQQPQQPKQSIDKPNNLANTLKTAPGTWNCSTCLSQNKAESGKCASCETPKPESPNGDKNNDVSIIKELKATSEQIEKARQFNLPDNFYLYEAKPECTGCRGCQNEE